MVGNYTEKPLGNTRYAGKGMHNRGLEENRTPTRRFFGAWSKERAVEVNDVYGCLIDRDAYTEYLIDRDIYREALNKVDYFHTKGAKMYCTMALRPKAALELTTIEPYAVLRPKKQLEVYLQRHMSDYRSAFAQRTLRPCEMYPYNNPRVDVRDAVTGAERK